ncbi:ABC transporter ATP-binding protein, partial [Candidatus Woesearchaeota archaeon]|nr:ABC transporter ATP-binding protein [Candidatus Woesearchaeota archaeon]
MLAIDIKRVVKTFGSGRTKITAVNNISLQINKGEIFGLLGVNGAGKSTLTNILSGLTYADSGTIKIFGLDFYEHEEEIKSRSNVATAYYDLNHSLTVMENLKIYAQLYGVKNYKEKIYALADKFLLTPYLNTITRKLSSGERIRAVLIKALLNDPELLFLDECTVGLDPDMAEIVRDYIQKYNQETGCTILFTSHYMQEVERLCKRIAFMDNGRIIKVAPAKELVGELELQTVIMH